MKISIPLKMMLTVKFWFWGILFQGIEVSGIMNNVAKLKSTRRGGYGNGDTAVDGVRTTCMQNSNHSSPFWTVHLGAAFIIYHIKVFGCYNDCNGVFSEVSLDNQNFINFDDQPKKVNDYHEFKPANPIPGKWVDLFMNQFGDLTFCEVEVMADTFYQRGWIQMTPVHGMEGSGPVLKTSSIGHALHCAALCLYNQMCFGMNVIVTSSQDMECELLGSDVHGLLTGTNGKTYYKIKYWE